MNRILFYFIDFIHFGDAVICWIILSHLKYLEYERRHFNRKANNLTVISHNVLITVIVCIH